MIGGKEKYTKGREEHTKCSAIDTSSSMQFAEGQKDIKSQILLSSLHPTLDLDEDIHNKFRYGEQARVTIAIIGRVCYNKKGW